jgi:hypothetical protein
MDKFRNSFNAIANNKIVRYSGDTTLGDGDSAIALNTGSMFDINCCNSSILPVNID